MFQKWGSFINHIDINTVAIEYPNIYLDNIKAKSVLQKEFKILCHFMYSIRYLVTITKADPQLTQFMNAIR